MGWVLPRVVCVMQLDCPLYWGDLYCVFNSQQHHQVSPPFVAGDPIVPLPTIYCLLL